MLGELRGAVTALALIVCGALAAATVDFGLPGQALLQSLRFHIAAGLLGLVVLLAFSGAWRRSLLFLLVFAIGTAQAGLVVYQQQQMRSVVAANGTRPLLRVMSFNALNGNPQGKAIADFITASGVDVVMLMESTSLAPHREQLFATYPYRAGCDDFARCGTVILSKTPLTAATVASLSDVWPNRLVTTSTEIDGTRINLVAAHMVKPYFDEFPYEEAWKLGKALEQLEGPLILGGDFNAAAWSDNIDNLVRAEKLVPPPFYPATWPVRSGPLGVPIDNLFTRAPLIINEISAFNNAMGSNHRGLIAEISIGQGG